MVAKRITTEERAELRDYLATAEAIAWDTCHKIYVLQDTNQVEQMRSFGYGEEPNSLVTNEEQTPKQMSATISKWVAEACPLRFVYSVATTESGEEFAAIVSQ